MNATRFYAEGVAHHSPGSRSAPRVANTPPAPTNAESVAHVLRQCLLPSQYSQHAPAKACNDETDRHETRKRMFGSSGRRYRKPEQQRHAAEGGVHPDRTSVRHEPRTAPFTIRSHRLIPRGSETESHLADTSSSFHNLSIIHAGGCVMRVTGGGSERSGPRMRETVGVEQKYTKVAKKTTRTYAEGVTDHSPGSHSAPRVSNSPPCGPKLKALHSCPARGKGLKSGGAPPEPAFKNATKPCKGDRTVFNACLRQLDRRRSPSRVAATPSVEPPVASRRGRRNRRIAVSCMHIRFEARRQDRHAGPFRRAQPALHGQGMRCN